MAEKKPEKKPRKPDDGTGTEWKVRRSGESSKASKSGGGLTSKSSKSSKASKPSKSTKRKPK